MYFEIYRENEDILAQELEMTQYERAFLICVLQNAEAENMNQDVSAMNSPRNRPVTNRVNRTPVNNGGFDGESGRSLRENISQL